MKKILLLVITCIFIFPILVSAEVCQKDDIVISKVELNEVRGNAEETVDPNNDNNQLNLNAKMNVIGDSLTYKVVIKNTSNSDYVFDKNQITKDYINYDISYEDNSNIIKAGEEKVIYLRLNYQEKPQVENLTNVVLKENSQVSFQLSKSNDNIINPETGNKTFMTIIILVILLGILLILRKKLKEISLVIMISLFLIPSIVQAICTSTLDINLNLEINAKEAQFMFGMQCNFKMKKLADSNTTGASNQNQNITAIIKSEEEPNDSNKEEKNIVSTPESEYPIYMWYEDGTIYWWSEDETPSLNENANSMFYRMNNLVNINGLEHFDVSSTKTIANMMSNTKISAPDSLRNWNTENITDIGGLFSWNKSMISTNGLENWNTKNLVKMSTTFCGCEQLKDLSGIENWNVEKVEDISFLFQSCTNIEKVDFSKWSTKSLKNMINSFGMWSSNGGITSDGKLKQILLSEKFDTSQVTNMYALFANNEKIEDYSFLQYFDVSNVENMAQMFQNNKNMKNLNDIKDWNVENVTTMQGMFNGSTGIEDASAINDWNITDTTNYQDMFYQVSTHPEFTKIQGTWSTNGTFTPTE